MFVLTDKTNLQKKIIVGSDARYNVELGDSSQRRSGFRNSGSDSRNSYRSSRHYLRDGKDNRDSRDSKGGDYGHKSGLYDNYTYRRSSSIRRSFTDSSHRHHSSTSPSMNYSRNYDQYNTHNSSHFQNRSLYDYGGSEHSVLHQPSAVTSQIPYGGAYAYSYAPYGSYGYNTSQMDTYGSRSGSATITSMSSAFGTHFTHNRMIIRGFESDITEKEIYDFASKAGRIAVLFFEMRKGEVVCRYHCTLFLKHK
ncbi:hypothetical protein RFI_23701 [Reticulomyxa filosa]|uniref:Uncharacterized protein n=1 Tax=Reticulomyxa filosa TaxID=46433 RepID=X6MJP1_RETFI|nr:hypothetical protein RFI_23701 [Reticulomyxa filosa]|eukprot:ETO13667.1 hypothetical protein RFI_23701 [Reticulomyxa filosa]